MSSFSSSCEIDLETLPDIGEQPHHPAKFSFQKRAFRTKCVVFRLFQPQWFQKWSWIHYDEARDLAFCFIYLCGSCPIQDSQNSKNRPGSEVLCYHGMR